MACKQFILIADGEFTVDAAETLIYDIPDNYQDGQMDFKNVGATIIRVRVGLSRNSKDITAKKYTYYLGAGESVNIAGIVKGQVTALGSAAGGLLAVGILGR